MQHRLKFSTLDNKTYSINPHRYKIKWGAPSASKFQWSVEKFFFYLWRNDLVCSEFPIKPYIYNNYRLDLINVDKKIVVEAVGRQHIEHIKHFNPTDDHFWAAIERDVLKAECVRKNGYSLIEVYPNNMPLSLDWLKSKYPKISWPATYPK